MKSKGQKGLLIILTGNGKGKTTCAIGMAIRAAGHGMRVAFIQFIKGNKETGEIKALSRFSDLIDVKVMGRGFTWKSHDISRDKEAAQGAWQHARDLILSGDYDLVILDEFTYAINYSMVSLKEVIDALAKRPAHCHVIITGRNAPGRLIDLADLVTEMHEIKHPFKNGIKAQRGIEF